MRIKKIQYSVLFFGIMLVCQVISVLAKEQTRQMISIQEAIELAQKQHPMIVETRENLNVAKTNIDVARSSFLPKLQLNEIYTRTNDPVAVFGINMWQNTNLGFGDLFRDFMDTQMSRPNDLPTFINTVDRRFYDVTDQGNFQTQLNLMQPIFNGGKEHIGYRMAVLQSNAMEHQEKRMIDMVTFQVIRSYLAIFLSTNYLHVAEKALESANEHLRIAESHVKSGTVVSSDLLRAKVHHASVEEMKISANNQLDLAIFMFNRSLGVDSNNDQIFTVNTDTFHALKLPEYPKMTETSLIQKAFETRNDLLAIKLS
ncbi:MAG: TolC family protein, partial [Desulfobacterales bacterium]|nr:TolC family protein [Desulfobacterales bacterium]